MLKNKKQINKSCLSIMHLIKAFARKPYYFLRYISLKCIGIFLKTSRPQLESARLKKVLIIQLERIGDIVVSHNAVKSLCLSKAALEVYMLIPLEYKDLLMGEEIYERIYGLGSSRNIIENITLLKQIRKEKFDAVIDFTGRYSLLSGIIAYLTGIPIRIGSSLKGKEIFYNVTVEQSDEQHCVDEKYGLLENINHKPEKKYHKLQVSDKAEKKADIIFKDNGIGDKKPIVFHLGGYYVSQRWPVDKFIKLIKKVETTYSEYVAMIIATDEEIINQVKISLPDIPVLTELPLDVLVAVINKCSVFVGNNTGPLHIAAALDKKTVSSMGPTKPFRWYPLGDNHIVLRKNLQCSPCSKGTCESHECLQMIEVEDFMSALEKQIVIE